MKYCSECGHKVVLEKSPLVPMSRFVCTACRAVFYQSPRLAAGCIAEWKGRILLCRRAVEPARGRWGLPAGFVVPGESTRIAAARETLEEANVAVEIQRAYALFHVPHANQLRVIFLARLLDDKFTPGAETLEVRLFEEADVPWDDLAFATTGNALSKNFRDRAAGDLGFFFADIVQVEA
jgi:ADP-ribose pyrophosphatase YjhB (NUDIX family)